MIMKILLLFLLLAYLWMSFSLLFRERPEKPGRAAALLFFGPWISGYKNIYSGLAGKR